jgi:hypothetical protein
MHNSQGYRYKAAECLRAAQQARDPIHNRVHLSMAMSWLSLARQDEAMDASDASSTKMLDQARGTVAPNLPIDREGVGFTQIGSQLPI